MNADRWQNWGKLNSYYEGCELYSIEAPDYMVVWSWNDSEEQIKYGIEKEDDAAYIAAANPQVVLAMIERLEKLELMSRQWRKKFKDRGTELHIKRNLLQKNKKSMIRLENQVCKLEKKADWLAMELADIGILRRPCGKDCNPCDLTCRQEQWREAAHKAIEDKK